MHLKIDKELRDLLPPLDEGEYQQLRDSIIKAKGCRDAIHVWRGFIVDGHNRYGICVELGFTDDIQIIELPKEMTKDQVKLWIYENQLGRRNMTNANMSVMRGRHGLLLNLARGGDRRSDEFSKGQNEPLKPHSIEQLAEKYKVSPNTIKRDLVVASAPAEVIEQYQAGELTKAQVIEHVNGDPRTKPPEDAGDAWEAESLEDFQARKAAAKEARKRGPSGRETMKAKEAIDALGHAYNRVTRYASDRGVLPFLDKVQKQLRATGDLFEAFTKEYP